LERLAEGECVPLYPNATASAHLPGLVLFAFNPGEVCTCPSRALIQESIYDTARRRPKMTAL